MADRDIVILVEEPSAAEVVRAIAAKLGLGNRVQILKHQGSGDLKKSIAIKIVNDPFPATKFLVLCDADSNDCIKLKAELVAKVPYGKQDKTKVRIVCRELEAWYLAQPLALKNSGTLAKKISISALAKNPDELPNPKKLFMAVAFEKGQMEHARRIGPHLDCENTKSKSFQHFISALIRLSNL